MTTHGHYLVQSLPMSEGEDGRQPALSHSLCGDWWEARAGHPDWRAEPWAGEARTHLVLSKQRAHDCSQPSPRTDKRKPGCGRGTPEGAPLMSLRSPQA